MATSTETAKPNWFIQFMNSSIGKKIVMSLTGIFLILFLTVHLIGNLQLLIPDGGKTFNEYAHFMGHNKLIQIVSIGNFFFILLHIVYGIMLTLGNQKARPVQYAHAGATKKVSWSSKNMALLGTVILIFLVVHLQAFWAKSKFGGLEETALAGGVHGHDLYKATVIAFKEWWIVVLYVISMVGLAFHLIHGFQSAFQTIGFNHRKYTPFIKALGFGYAIIVPLLYAIIPVIMFFQNQ